MIYLFTTTSISRSYLHMFYSIELGELLFCKSNESNSFIDGNFWFYTFISHDRTRIHKYGMYFKVDTNMYNYVEFDDIKPDLKIFAENYLLNLIIENI